MKIFALTWFEIKKIPSLQNGGNYLLNYILRARVLPTDLYEGLMTSVERNCYFAHSDNVILSLMCKPNSVIRSQTLEIYEFSKIAHRFEDLPCHN